MDTEIQYLKKKIIAQDQVQESIVHILNALCVILKEAGIVDEFSLKAQVREDLTNG